MKIRKKIVRQKARRYHLIKIAIRYFETQMQYRRAVFKSLVEKTKNGSLTFVECGWEKDYKEFMKLRTIKREVSVKTINT